ncbi:hypothetical protein FQA47_021027 [Oryzias melastigma]|uniref:Uncharacterized protein n=1 Tax=Oryzias melastigma TaxID=30732 RepID=A0A834FGB6_ORYME|nr:hypothetical protein FQA47_021027 [Oryzias melastigma]
MDGRRHCMWTIDQFSICAEFCERSKVKASWMCDEANVWFWGGCCVFQREGAMWNRGRKIPVSVQVNLVTNIYSKTGESRRASVTTPGCVCFVFVYLFHQLLHCC